MKKSLIDRVIGAFSPKAALQRMQYTTAMDLLETYAKKSRRYEGAGFGRRVKDWNATSGSASTEIHNALSILRNRSRDLVRNNPYAKKAVKEIANNVVGTGILPTPLLDEKSKNKLQTNKIKNAFKAWADSTGCDFDGHLNYWGIQHLAMRTVAESGEVIIRKHIVPDHPIFPLQLQLLEPDFIDTTRYQAEVPNSGGNYIYYGVEFNKFHKVVAYWLWSNHPGDNLQYTRTSERIPAEEIIHVFEKERPGQFRGVPFGSSSMLRMKDFDEYEDAQLIRQKIAACFTVFITDSNISPVTGIVDENGDSDNLEKVQPGIIEMLTPGKTVTTATPPDAGSTYEMYGRGVLQGIAAGWGMDYPTLSGDLSNVNFSSGRMGWIMFHRNIEVWQWNMLIPMCCDKTWQWFLQLAVVTGYAKSLLIPVRWTPPRRQMIDPVKETEAEIKAVRANFESWSEVVRKRGYNPEEVLDELIQDAKAFDAAKLQPECDPRYDPKKIGSAGEQKVQ